jgi:hypothetical protein
LPKSYLKNSIVTAVLLSAVMAFVLLPTTLERGLFFREDYLPFLTRVAWLFALVSLAAILKGDKIWRGDVDILLTIIVGLYFLTNLWAQSKMDAMDGALKYAGYLMVFIMARYAASSPLGNRILRNLLVVCGVIVAGAGYLTAAGIANYPSSVVGGALLGSFQYPNALAAFAMFLLFFLYYAWYEGFQIPSLDLFAGVVYSACAFLLVGSVFLTNSRATLLIFGGFVALYGVLLPKGVRARLLSRGGVSFVSFAAVASKMDAALGANDSASMKQMLVVGLALAAVLEVGRWFLERRLSLAVNAQAEAAATSTDTQSAAVSLKAVFLRTAIAGLAVIVAGAALIGAVKNPATAEQLAKVLPERIVYQLRTMQLMDVSLLIRFMAAKDALSIALGYPFGTGAGGWEALYHQYHRTPYWFTETHNHFAQMLVEVGFPGFLLYAVFWALLAYATIKTYLALLQQRSNAKDASEERPAAGSERNPLAKVVSSGMAVFALCIHSALDFDLSLPAISVSLFAAVGVLLADVSGYLPRTADLLARLRRSGPSADSLKGTSRKAVASQGAGRLTFPWSLVFTILIAAALVPTVVATTNRLYSGMAYASRGDQIMKTSGDVILARKYIAEATKRDKWNPSYPLELAEWAADDFAKTANPASKGMIPLYLKAAKMADPSNLERQILEFQLLRRTGFTEDALRSAYEVVLMMPTNRSYHETLADMGRAVIAQHAKALTQPELTDSQRDEHLRMLSLCAELLTSSFDILNAKHERVTGIYTKVFSPTGLEFTPKLALAAGEVAFLRGDIEESGTLLSAAASDKSLEQEAYSWLARLSEAAGYQTTLPEGFEPDPEENRKMAALFGSIRGAR